MARALPLFPALALALWAMGCAPLPGGDLLPPATQGPAPALLPLDDLLAQAAAPATAPRAGETLAARAARLKARAALMRGPIMDPATRIRLSAAIAAGRA